MKKTLLVKAVIDALTEKLTVLAQAAMTSRAEATHEHNRAENKYDTRSLEAGYLAGGQARQAQDLQDAITAYETLELRAFASDDPVRQSALVTLEMDGERATYFLGPKAGGLEVTCTGVNVIVITPQSPLGLELIGRKAGQRWRAKRGRDTVDYHVIAVV